MFDNKTMPNLSFVQCFNVMGHSENRIFKNVDESVLVVKKAPCFWKINVRHLIFTP